MGLGNPSWRSTALIRQMIKISRREWPTNTSPVPLDCPTTQEARRIHSQMSRQLFTSLCNRTNFTWRIEFGLVTLGDERQAHHGRT